MSSTVEKRGLTTPTGTPSPPPPDSIPTYTWTAGKLLKSGRPLPWHDGDDFAATLKYNGFNKYASIDLGDECEDVRLQVFDRAGDSDEIPHWLGDLTIGNVSYTVWIDDVADLLDLMEHVAPTIQAVAALSDRAERLREEREQRRAEARERRMWGGR